MLTGDRHTTNFIEAVRSRDRRKLNADILEGHLSTLDFYLLLSLSYGL